MTETNDLFWKLAQPEHPKAQAFCRKLTGNREDGDDLYQDSLVSALSRFDDLREQASFRPWLYRIIVNTFHNRMRRPWWRRQVRLKDAPPETLAVAGPEAVVDARRRLEIGFACLSPQQRSLIILFELEGWSISELARLLDKTEGTIKVQLSAVRRKMRKAIAASQDGSKSKKTENQVMSEAKICVAPKPGID